MVSSLEKKNLRKKMAMIIVIIMFGNLVRISTFLVVIHLIKCIAEMSTYEENPSGGTFLMIYWYQEVVCSSHFYIRSWLVERLVIVRFNFNI